MKFYSMGFKVSILIFSLLNTISAQEDSKSPDNRECKLGEFPSLVSITASLTDGDYFQCAGVLLDKYHVLMAANCINVPIEKFHIIIGDVRFDSQVSDSRQTDTAENFVIHPYYDKELLQNNLAILKLKVGADENSNVGAAIFKDLEPPPFLAKLILAGWEGSEALCLVRELTVYNRKNCTSFEKSAPIKKPAQNQPLSIASQFCAGDNTGKIFDGGVNGPAYLSDGKNMKLVGFTSYLGVNASRVCVFSDITYYSQWIEEAMSEISTDDPTDEPTDDFEITHKKETPAVRRKNGANRSKNSNDIKIFVLPMLMVWIKIAIL